MAYVKPITVKGHTYYTLVKSIRNGEKVRQKHLKYLGKNPGRVPKEDLINIDYLLDLAGRTKFQRYMLEKSYRLTHLLHAMEDDKQLNKMLALKGGTALNFVFLPTPRLSIDVDFNYIGSPDKEVMLGDYKKIDTILSKIYGSLGYKVVKNKRYALLQHTLSYRDLKGNVDKIKVEINFLERVPVAGVQKKQFRHIFDVPRFNVRTYRLEEVFAGKLNALIERGTPRDLFDVCNLVNVKMDDKLVKKLFVLAVCMRRDIRETSTANIKNISKQDVTRRLVPLLPKREKFDAVEGKKRIIPFVKKLLELDENEKLFVRELYDHKKFEPELLFGEAGPKEYPPAEWLLQKFTKK